MIWVLIVGEGLNMARASRVSRLVEEHEDDLFYVLCVKRGGAEHYLADMPRVSLGRYGPHSILTMARQLRRADDDFTVFAIGSPELSVRVFDAFPDEVRRVYCPTGVTAPVLRNELMHFDLNSVEEICVETQSSQVLVRGLLPREFARKVAVDDTWARLPNVRYSPFKDAGSLSGIPLMWSGSFRSAGSGFRDFSRLFGVLGPEWVPVVVAEEEVGPDEFNDFASNFGASGAFLRSMVLTAPSRESLGRLVATVGVSGGALVSTALVGESNALVPLSVAANVPVVGYDNPAFLGQVWEPQLKVCDPGDITELGNRLLQVVGNGSVSSRARGCSDGS